MKMSHHAEWMAKGKCHRQPELIPMFFSRLGKRVEEAKAFCADCPVRSACLQYALDHNITTGVWGGASERQRRRMKRASKTKP